MKATLACVVWTLALFASLTCAAAPAKAQSTASGAAAGGIRYHADHSVFEKYPYGGDFAYAAAYEWHEDAGYWQIALDYAPAVTGTNDIQNVWTPQLSLIFNDGIWRGGGGIMDSYITDSEKKSTWTGFYWQFLAGISLPVKSCQLQLMTYYVFANTKALKEFSFNDLEFGVWLNFPM